MAICAVKRLWIGANKRLIAEQQLGVFCDVGQTACDILILG